MSSIKWICVFAFILAIIMAGCGQEKTPEPSTIQPLDTSRVQGVKANINTDPILASENIQIDVKYDVVTLSGTVHSEESKKKAEELAGRTHGVSRVINNLEVVSE